MILIESKQKRILDGGRGHHVGSKDQKGHHWGNMYHFGDSLYIATSHPINKELEAVVYTVNQEEYETSIVIDGSIKKELFTEEASFAGYFKIESYPKSYYAGTTAKIDWHSDVAQNIRFMCAGTISSLDIDRVEIDRTMDNIKIILRDGTIISTKKEDAPSELGASFFE